MANENKLVSKALLQRFFTGLKGRFIQTVNGIGPDANGNVAITGDVTGDLVTEFTFNLQPEDWVQIDGELHQAVTIPGSSPTDVAVITFAGFDNDEAVAYTIDISNTAAYGIYTSLGEAADTLWHVAYRTPAASLSGFLIISGYLIHGGNGSGSASWQGLSDKPSLFVLKTVTRDNVSISSGSSYNTAISVTGLPDGYTPIAFRYATISEASSSGANWTNCHFYGWAMDSSAHTVAVRIKNTAGSAAKVKITIAVVCALSSVCDWI